MNEPLVTALAAELVRSGALPGKKAFQKLFYLLDRAGVPTELEFVMHFYGPYSFELAEEMTDLARIQVLKVREGSIEADARAEQIRKRLRDEVKPYEKQLALVLETFRNRFPNELELAATTHFVAERLASTSREVRASDVADAVRGTKRDKYSPDQIAASLRELRTLGLLSPKVVIPTT